jgi:hypothetical protein
LWHEGYLIGIDLSWVDDLFGGGDENNETYIENLAEMVLEIHLKVKKSSGIFCGKTVERLPNKSISLYQPEAIDSLEQIELPKHRRKDGESSLTAEEISDLRSGNGSMSWVTRQTRGDMLIYSSSAAQCMGNPKIRNIVEFNKGVDEFHETRDTKLIFQHVQGRGLSDLIPFTCADSSLGNMDDPKLGERVKSQCGHVTGFCDSDIANLHAEGYVWPVMLHSGTIHRVVRSTLSAEANGLIEGAESCDYLRALLGEVLVVNESARALNASRLLSRAVWFTDAKSLKDLLMKDKGQASDKRIRILIAQLREMLDEPDTAAHWIDTKVMLADSLTKIDAERGFLREAMTTSRWSPLSTAIALMAKTQVREGRQRRADLRRAAKSSSH